MKLLDLVNREKRVSVTRLSERLGVSEVTIRKDLSTLEQKGLLRREHGYAVMISSDDIAKHLSFHYDRKKRIALQAAQSVKDGETVLLDSGACCTLLAEELATNRESVTIITNSAFLAGFIRKMPHAHVILLGGEYQNESQITTGPMVERCIEDFHVDKMFVSSAGLSASGFMAADLSRGEMMHELASHATRILVLTDSECLKPGGVVLAFPYEEVQAVYTDSGLSDDLREKLTAHGITVETVSKEIP